MTDEEIKAYESVKSMFEGITIKNVTTESKMTLYPIGIIDVLRIIPVIETQQKEIEELKMKLEVEKIDNKYNQEEACEEMIPRYKIKAKIEEIENTGIDVAWEQVNYTIREQDRAKIQVLKSLLEEE